MSNKKTPFGTKLGFWIIFGTCWLVGLLPYWFLYYVVVGILYFFVYMVGRYRVRVVRINLSRSFPEKTKKELRKIERGFYRNLAEYFVDAIDLASITERQWKKRVVYLNLDAMAEEMNGSNWVDLMAHFGSWEMFGSFGFHPSVGASVAAYHPLTNKAFDMYYIKIRNAFQGIKAVPANELLRFYMTHLGEKVAGRPMGITLIADQNAPVDAQSQWILFLNQPTVFFHGGEKIARKFGIPVYYMHIRKTARGKYEVWYERLWDGVSPIEDHEITNMYAARLEADIRRCPELWVWSHKRWKQRPRGEELAEFNAKWGTCIPDEGIY